MKLDDPSLLRSLCRIGETWTAADRGTVFDVVNPATGAVVATVPRAGKAETERAIQCAAAALPAWRGLTAKARGGLLRRWHDLILSHREDLARIMTAEQGKPQAEARGEVSYGAAFIDWFAEEGKRVYGDIIPSPFPGRRIMVLKEPVGVVAAITPWNFPNAMITRKCGPALAAGCTVVVKPAEDTPLSALALAELAHRAGIPAGVLNVVTGDPVEIGAELTSNPLVRKLSFTGSTAVGKTLMKQCADTMKKISLELGGNAPFIVFDDADLDAAVAGAIASKFRNSGQTCICANRMLVQNGIHDAFANRLVEAVGQLDLGPLIHGRAVEGVERLVAEAVASGARVLCGGARRAEGDNHYAATVLADVTPDMACARREIFGPVAPLIRFATEEDAIHLANDTPYGLAAYAYTRDGWRCGRLTCPAAVIAIGQIEFNLIVPSQSGGGKAYVEQLPRLGGNGQQQQSRQ